MGNWPAICQRTGLLNGANTAFTCAASRSVDKTVPGTGTTAAATISPSARRVDPRRRPARHRDATRWRSPPRRRRCSRPAHDHLLEPAAEVQATRRIQRTEVAGMQPSVIVDRLRCLFGAIEIFGHRRGCSNDDLPVFPTDTGRPEDGSMMRTCRFGNGRPIVLAFTAGASSRSVAVMTGASLWP